MLDSEALRRLTTDLVGIYSEAELRMLDIVARRLERGIETEGWARAKLEEVFVVRDELELSLRLTNKQGADEAERAVRQAFVMGAEAAEGDAGAAVRVDTNSRALMAHVEAARRSVSVPGGRVVDQLLTVYQRAAMVETSQLLIGVQARRQASQHVVDDLVNRGISSFTDRLNRRWSLRAYAEMAVRTQSANASVAGHVNGLLEHDITLVRITSHADSCRMCMPWQGRVLSVGGSPTGRYPTLEDAQSAGLYHPNCRHSQAAYIPGVTRAAPDVHKFDAVKSGARVEQRRLERGIRYWRQREVAALGPEARQHARKARQGWENNLKAHISRHDLKRLRYRER